MRKVSLFFLSPIFFWSISRCRIDNFLSPGDLSILPIFLATMPGGIPNDLTLYFAYFNLSLFSFLTFSPLFTIISLSMTFLFSYSLVLSLLLLLPFLAFQEMLPKSTCHSVSFIFNSPDKHLIFLQVIVQGEDFLSPYFSK